MAINFPDSPTTNDLFTSGGKTWEYDGTAWTIKAATTSIATGSITYDKLASDAVTTVKIADGAITAAKIADGTVVAAEIASSAITTVKINDSAVTTGKINDSAVTTGKINDSAVTTAKINDAAVTTAKINDAAVTTTKVNDSAVTTAKINDAAVTQAKLGTTLSAVTVTTAANRDTAVASPFTGQLVFLTDTKKIQVWDGTSWLNITLAPPETPTSLSATALSATSVSIAFTAGGANGSPITNYKYALSTNGGSTYGSFTALSPEDITTPITISGLTAGTTYYIKLKAVNDMGDSVASAAVSITTLSTPDAPTSLSATPATTSVDISFTPGGQGGSAISNYQYALSTNGGSTYGSFTALATPDATSPITITGLTADTAYYVKLKAVNGDGAGTESSAVSFTTFGPISSINYLVVAGGAAGAIWQGGGGGAGGLRSTVTATGGGGTLETALAVTPGVSYTVTVGAGGAVGTSPSPYTQGAKAANGSNSIFSTITSIGGGGGSCYSNSGTAQGSTGGSGGGGGSSSGAAGLEGGAGTANQGYAGGNGYASNHGAGGGGGAGGSGVNATPGTGGGGGVGIATTITGSSVYYAGGGGGAGYENGPSAGGSGIGGNGANHNTGVNNGTAGTVNTGSGGGGETTGGYLSGAGGSGIVILRYPDTKLDIATIGAGLTYTFTNTGGYKIYRFTAGTGSITI